MERWLKKDLKRQTTPGDIPDENQVPHAKRNLSAQLVVRNANPQQRVKVQQQRTSFSQRMKRSLEWEESFSQDVCSSVDIEKYVQIVARLLSQANTLHKKVTLIETLAHMGLPQVLPVLAPYVQEIFPKVNVPDISWKTKNKRLKDAISFVEL